MKNYELLPYSDDLLLAKAVADLWWENVVAAAPSRKPLSIALAGGRVARRFFAAAAQHAATHPEALAEVHFFWGDERCVPGSDPESNYSVAEENFLRPARVEPSRIHRIRGELPPAQAAAEAEAEVLGIVPGGAAHLPVFDLVLLGMGEDGHVASLFPNGPTDLSPGQPIYLPIIGPKPPPQRITMTYPTLGRAREVLVLASGVGKVQALRDSLDPEGVTPLARLLRLRHNTTIFTDINLAA